MCLETNVKLAAILILLLFIVSCGGGSSNLGLSSPVTSAVVITTSALPEAESGSTYAAKIQAAGGTGVYDWKVASGSLPAGVSLLSDGTLSGSPADEGDYSFAVRASDTSSPPQTASKDYSVKVKGPKLKVTTASVPVATVGSPYAATLDAIGGSAPYTWSIASGSLPSSMALAATTGVISGTPSADGTFTFTAQAQDAKAQKATSTLTLSVASTTPTPLAITTASLPDGTVGTNYSATVQASGGVAPYGWSISSGLLPPGLGLNANTGVIWGTPSSAGTFDITLGIQDSTGASATNKFSIKIAAALVALQITTAALPSGMVESPYSATLAATGGTPPYTWSIVSGTLPSSLALDATTGVISGTPSAGGDFNFTAEVKDANSANATSNLTLSLSSTALDQYGGRTDMSCAGGVKQHFYTEKIGDRWWFCTPAGHPFFSQSVLYMDYGATDPYGRSLSSTMAKKYGNSATWADANVARIKSWGFNTLGAYTSSYAFPYSTNSTYPVDENGLRSIPNKAAFSYQINPGADATRNTALQMNVYGKRVLATDAVKNMAHGWSPVYFNGGGWAYASAPDWADDRIYSYLDAELETANSLYGIQNAMTSPYFGYLLAVSVDDGDQLSGFTTDCSYANEIGLGHVSPEPGWMIASQTPVMTGAFATDQGQAYFKYYVDTEVKNKRALRDWLAGKYTTIEGLNRAWGSNYTQWDSTGTSITGEPVGKGDGNNVVFSHTLAQLTPSMYSTQIFVNGTPIAGTTAKCSDLAHSTCNYGDTTTGSIVGPQVTGSLTYANGALSLAFFANPVTIVDCKTDGSTVTLETLTQHGFWTGAVVTTSGTTNCSAAGAKITVLDPWHFTFAKEGGFAEQRYNSGVTVTALIPQAGDAITVDYVANGWRIGTGFMDEDGSHSWMGSDFKCLTNTPSAVKADLTSYLLPYATHYFSSTKAVLDNRLPGVLYQVGIMAWNVPARALSMQAASKYVDILASGDKVPYTQQKLDFVYSNWGDRPLFTGVFVTANADSPYLKYNPAGSASSQVANQEAKGQAYHNVLNGNMGLSYGNGSHPYIGISVWSYHDMQSELTNWGLIDAADNAYDGHEDVTATVSCSPPLEAYTCGGEPAYPTWQANTAVAVPAVAAGNRVQVIRGGINYIFEVSKAGTTNSTEPAWPTSLNVTVTDGTAVWKNVGTRSNANGFGDMISGVKKANALWLTKP